LNFHDYKTKMSTQFFLASGHHGDLLIPPLSKGSCVRDFRPHTRGNKFWVSGLRSEGREITATGGVRRRQGQNKNGIDERTSFISHWRIHQSKGRPHGVREVVGAAMKREGRPKKKG